MRNKMFYAYILIEFALFIASFFFAVNPIISFNYRILVTIGIGINIPFSLILKPKEEMDKWFALSYSILLFIGELLYTITGNFILFMILFLIGFITVSIRLFIIMKDSPKIKTVMTGVLLGVTTVLLGLLLFKVIDLRYMFFYHIILILLLNTSIMVYRYKNCFVLEKPNWLFGGSGSLIFILYLLSEMFGPSMDDTALMKEMIMFGSAVLLIPSVLMILMSFMLFEQREA